MKKLDLDPNPGSGFITKPGSGVSEYGSGTLFSRQYTFDK